MYEQLGAASGLMNRNHAWQSPWPNCWPTPAGPESSGGLRRSGQPDHLGPHLRPPRLWEWITGGELMMTNGLSIPADPEGQVELAEALVNAGASALAIGEQMHAPELHPQFLEACDRLPLPVISIPYPLPFIAIARSVAESSLLEESRRLRQTARIYDLLRLAGHLRTTG